MEVGKLFLMVNCQWLIVNALGAGSWKLGAGSGKHFFN